jgi:hypothetical protein
VRRISDFKFQISDWERPVVLSRRCSFALTVIFFVFGGIVPSVFGQLQLEWARTYRLDPAKTNAASKIALTSDGIVVAGTSASAAGDLDYLVIKYKPNGDVAWQARYDMADGNFFNDELRGMTVDPAGNVIVTGTTATVKFSGADGRKLWDQQSIGGRAIVANSNFVYVTGFSTTEFATAQLTNNNTDGGVGWVRTLDPTPLEDISAGVALSPTGNVLVAGWKTYSQSSRGQTGNEFLFTSYSTKGDLQWQIATNRGLGFRDEHYVAGLEFDDAGTAYMLGSFSGTPTLIRLSEDGTVFWINRWTYANAGYGIKITPEQDVVCIGDGVISKFAPDGNSMWTQIYGESAITTCLAVARNGEIVAAGFKPRTFLDNDIFILRLGPDGSKRFSLAYDSPQHGTDSANAIVLDKSGSAYVTGYSTTAEGGSEFITIKYVPEARINANPDGTMHVEFRSTPGQVYEIQGSTDFFNWQSLITNTADGSGLVKFDDTNAVTVPYRFYRGKQP